MAILLDYILEILKFQLPKKRLISYNLLIVNKYTILKERLNLSIHNS